MALPAVCWDSGSVSITCINTRHVSDRGATRKATATFSNVSDSENSTTDLLAIGALAAGCIIPVYLGCR